jgi:hypothetical protein
VPSTTTVKRVVVTAAVVGALYVAGSLLLQQDDEEDRPPIIVKNGSIIFEVDVARPWKKDLIGRQWKPDQSNGKKVERFDVTFTGAQGCNPASGTEVSITYTDTEARVFTFERKRKHGFGKREPKLDSPVDLAATSTQTGSRLTYTSGGRITSVVVSGGSQTQTCSMPSAGDPTVTVQPRE